LEAIFRESLGLREGSETLLSPSFGHSRRVREWIELGGVLEDEGSILATVGRFYRHFHDPLKSWDAAGLSASGLGQSESSIRWMQNRRQTLTGAAGGNWSWSDARRMYYQSLIEPDPERRDALLAATFRALGQIMHLVVDASNPDHARNDPHPLPSAPLLGILFWNYDKDVESRHGRAGSEEELAFVRRYLSNPIEFDPAILQFPNPPDEQLASVPISRLIDADVYTGGNPDVTFNAANFSAPAAVGIAEISNANFFSSDTLAGQYPNPPLGTEGLVRTELELPRRAPGGLNLVRRYYSRPAGHGFLPANPLRAECAGARNARAATAPYPCVDDLVYDQVAAHMLPRAVGYARGVLEYFFRGDFRASVTATSGGVFINVQNFGEEPAAGRFEVYARRHKGTAAERRELVALVNGDTLVLEPGEDRTLPLELSSSEPAAYFMLVFRGRLGLEEDAVVGQIFNVPHVRIVPDSYNATVARPACTLQVPRPTADIPLRETLTCRWRTVEHQLLVRVATNFSDATPANPAEPAISRIEAVWQGVTPGPARLRINAEEYPSGVWQRTGNEPDPQAFAIDETTARGDSRLRVTVTARGGGSATSLIPILRTMTQEAWKRIDRPSIDGWRITAGDATVTDTNVSSTTPFVVEIVGGYPYPTSISRDGESISVTQVGVNRFASQRTTTFDQTVIGGTFTPVEATYRGIALTPPPFPSAPDVDFTAVLRPRPLSGAELRFWNAFVAPGPPPADEFVLRAQEQGTQETP
jgi:hypothetical protein